jgi:hypothetical protein
MSNFMRWAICVVIGFVIVCEVRFSAVGQTLDYSGFTSDGHIRLVTEYPVCPPMAVIPCATLTIDGSKVPAPGGDFFLHIKDKAASGTPFHGDLFITDNVEIVEVSTAAVRAIGKMGRICEVFGHNWRSGRPGEGNGFLYADYRPNTTFRTCDVCGTCQSQPMEWRQYGKED